MYLDFYSAGSMSVNVSVTSSKDEYINAGQLRSSSSSRDMLVSLLPIGFAMLLMLHKTMFMEFQFL